MAKTDYKKIHLIDDDPSSLQVLEFILKKRGYMVQSSPGGIEALEVLKSYSPDLILLDILMPEMDGYQVCTTLKGDNRLAAVPVIFITAANETSDLVKGFDAGAVDFISKPFNKAELLARVHTHIELKRSRDLVERKNNALKLEIRSRKQTEEKFRALSQTAFEAVLFLQNNNIVEYNKAAADLLGLKAGKPATLSSFTDAKGAGVLRSILQTKGANGPWEMNFINSHGDQFYGLVQYQHFVYKGKNVSVLAIRDITRQKEIDNEIFTAIIDAEEKERKRFSRDMHDGLGALLSTLKIYINLFQKENKSHSEREMLLGEINDTLNKAVESARTIANNLMPSVLMDHGLLKALKSFTDALNKTGVISIELLYPPEQRKIDPGIETHIYRIALELINNTLKYAEATEINLELDFRENSLRMKYRDNGVGFDYNEMHRVKAGNQGLRNILSRVNFMNGEGQFHTSPGKGLLFTLEVPL